MMNTPDCCLTIVFPKSLEENVIDLLLLHPDLAGGFTTLNVEGHGSGATYRTVFEQVRGRTRHVQMQIVLARSDADMLLNHMKAGLPNREIAYWITPVMEFGRFA